MQYSSIYIRALGASPVELGIASYYLEIIEEDKMYKIQNIEK